MNGKQAKMLRKLGRTDKESKRLFHELNADAKSQLRKNVFRFHIEMKAAELSSDNSEPEMVSEDYETL